mgnify:FL=1
MINTLKISVESCVSPLSTRRVNRGLSCMKKIKLTQGKYALVDDEDYEALNKLKWRCSKGGNTFYAYGTSRDITTNKEITVLMHRLVINTPKGLHTDHINGNGLDNRKSNLRACTLIENMRNKKIHRNGHLYGTTKSRYNSKKPWEANTTLNGKKVYLGVYKTAKEAHNVVMSFIKTHSPSDNNQKSV